MPATTVSLDPPAREEPPSTERVRRAVQHEPLHPWRAESKPLAPAELAAAPRATIQGLRLGHSRIFVRPAARSARKARSAEVPALLSTIELAQQAGANVNLTWWKGHMPFPKLQALSWPTGSNGGAKWPKAAPRWTGPTGRRASMEQFADVIQRVQLRTHLSRM